MIAFLRGSIQRLTPTKVIIETHGVGYLVHIPLTVSEKLSGKQECALTIVTVVREDAITLYGFLEEFEKEIFELLTGVSGIGARTALTIMSGIALSDFQQAIGTADVNRLATIPGIGKKTAERLILELKDKMPALSITGAKAPNSARSEAVAALVALGYNQKFAESVVRKISDQSANLTVEETIKLSLREIMQG